MSRHHEVLSLEKVETQNVPESLLDWLEANIDFVMASSGHWRIPEISSVIVDPATLLAQFEQEPTEEDGGMKQPPEKAMEWLRKAEPRGHLLYFSL